VETKGYGSEIMFSEGVPQRACDIAYQQKTYTINMTSPLALALTMMTGNLGIYRLTLLDVRKRVKGVISGLRIAEIMANLKGEGIKRRAGKGLEPLLKQPVQLFVNEYLHKLSFEMPIKGIVSYIVENKIGHIVLVDQMNTLRGIITERCILDRLPQTGHDISVSAVMTGKVHTVTVSQTLRDAVEIMSSHGVRRLPVTDNGDLRGIITVADALRHLTSSDYHIEAVLSKKDMSEFMLDKLSTVGFANPDPLRPDDGVDDLLERLAHRPSFGFPVVDDSGNMKGIVTSRDLVTKLPGLIGIDRFVDSLKRREQSD
jgi:CBS domain-containing protein